MVKKKPGDERTGLVSVDEGIDAIGKAALQDARRREALKKRDAERAAAARKPLKRP